MARKTMERYYGSKDTRAPTRRAERDLREGRKDTEARGVRNAVPSRTRRRRLIGI